MIQESSIPWESSKSSCMHGSDFHSLSLSLIITDSLYVFVGARGSRVTSGIKRILLAKRRFNPLEKFSLSTKGNHAWRRGSVWLVVTHSLFTWSSKHALTLVFLPLEKKPFHWIRTYKRIGRPQGSHTLSKTEDPKILQLWALQFRFLDKWVMEEGCSLSSRAWLL